MRLRPLLFLSLAAAAAACGGSTADERLGAAEHSLGTGDTDDARRGVELLMNSTDTASMSAAELCRAALLYTAISEDTRDGSEADAAMAARCVRRALQRDPAAVDSFMQTLPVEQRAMLSMAIQLSSGSDTKILHDYEEPDSIPAITSDSHE